MSATAESLTETLEILRERWRSKSGAKHREEILAMLRASRTLCAHEPLDLRGMSFTPEDLAGLDLSHARLDGAIFDNCNVSNARFQGASLKRSSWSHTTATGADFLEADLRGSVFQSCNLARARLIAADCGNVLFSESVLRGARLSAAKLGSAQFEGTDLDDVSFAGSDPHDGEQIRFAAQVNRIHERLKKPGRTISAAFARLSTEASLAILSISAAVTMAICAYAVSRLDLGMTLVPAVVLLLFVPQAVLLFCFVGGHALLGNRNLAVKPDSDPREAAQHLGLLNPSLDQNHLYFLMLLLSQLAPETAGDYLRRYLDSEVPEDAKQDMIRILLEFEKSGVERNATSQFTSWLYTALDNGVHGTSPSVEAWGLRRHLTHRLLVKLWVRDRLHQGFGILVWTLAAPLYSWFLGLVLIAGRPELFDASSRRTKLFFTTIRVGRYGEPFSYIRLRRIALAPDAASWRRVLAAVLRRFSYYSFPATTAVVAGRMNILGPLPLFRVQYDFLRRECEGCWPSIPQLGLTPPAARLLLAPGLVSTASVTALRRELTDGAAEGDLDCHCCDFARHDIECVRFVLHRALPVVLVRDVWLGLRAIVWASWASMKGGSDTESERIVKAVLQWSVSGWTQALDSLGGALTLNARLSNPAMRLRVLRLAGR